MKNLKKDQRSFYKQAYLMLSLYGVNSTDPQDTEGIVKTPFGRLRVHISSKQEDGYLISMRFVQPGKFDQEKFQACFSDITGATGLDEETLAWDLAGENPDFIIDQFEERLDNLLWLSNPDNMSKMIN